MKTKTTIYQALLATGTDERHVTYILDELEIDKDSILPFEPGQLMMTKGLRRLVDQGLDPCPYLLLHLLGKWGDLSLNDHMANLRALQEGRRLTSAYRAGDWSEQTVYICTAPDRNCTIGMLSSEYHRMFHLEA